MEVVSLKSLEMALRGAMQLPLKDGNVDPQYTTLTLGEAEEIADALMVLRNLRELEAIRLKQVEGIMSDIKDGYEFPAIRQAQLSDYARDIQMLTALQRKN